MPRPSPAKQQHLVTQWNALFSVGQAIKYWPGPVGVGVPKVGKTTSPAQMLGGHTAVVWVDCASGCVGLDHVEAI